MTSQMPTIRRLGRPFAGRVARAMVALGALAVAMAWAPTSASAHSGDQSYVYLDVGEDGIGGRVELAVADIEKYLGFDLVTGGAELAAGLAEAEETLQRYADEHLSIGVNGQLWDITFEGIETLSENPNEPERNYVLLAFDVEHDFAGPVPRQFEVTFDPFFEENPDRDALLLIGNDWQSGVFNNAEEVLVRFAPGESTQTVSLDDGAWYKNVAASAKLGIDHIKTGPDHILFILVLLLPAVLTFSAGGWQPTGSFVAALWRIMKIATMFTVAHTITFTLAGLDILPLPPSKFVESVIAISIALAALHNLRPIVANKEWAIAFGFGLFHGMGFAALVDTLDVSRRTQVISLLGRNLGIEIGQVAVILLSFPALFMLSRTRLYSKVFTYGSILLAIISVAWMIERVFETSLGVSDLVNPVLDFPRALLPVVVITVFAALWWRRERAIPEGSIA